MSNFLLMQLNFLTAKFMRISMPQVRVSDKYQITLPSSIVRAAHLQPGDVLDVNYRNGLITFTVKSTSKKRRSIMDYIGITNGVYGTTANEVDAYISSERESWIR